MHTTHHTTTTDTTTAATQRRLDPVAAALTASAFVLAALFIATLGGLFNQPAYAQSAVASGGTALVSMQATTNNEIVVTLDESTGTLRTFGVGVGGNRNVEQFDLFELDELFTQAQRASRGR